MVEQSTSTAKRRKTVIFWGVLAVLNLVVAFGLWKGYQYLKFQEYSRLNRSAWEASYAERNLPIPPTGPRDGYWGTKMGEHPKHAVLGWTAPALDVKGMLEFDSHGIQHADFGQGPRLNIVIVGASVALGGYASSIAQTYFHQLGARLLEDGLPCSLSVISSGGWKSEQELAALRLFGPELHPDLVVFIDGLNDLTVGSNANTRFGVPTKTLDGSKWQFLYHEHDYDARVRVFLDNMKAARDSLATSSTPIVFVLQPALFEKPQLSAIENSLLNNSLRELGAKQALVDSYVKLRAGLAALVADHPDHFVDLSGLFNGETATTFTDVWHFADPGHDRLAAQLHAALLPIVRDLHSAKSHASGPAPATAAH